MLGSMVALPNGFSAAVLEGSLCKASRETQVTTGDYTASVLPAPSLQYGFGCLLDMRWEEVDRNWEEGLGSAKEKQAHQLPMGWL